MTPLPPPPRRRDLRRRELRRRPRRGRRLAVETLVVASGLAAAAFAAPTLLAGPGAAEDAEQVRLAAELDLREADTASRSGDRTAASPTGTPTPTPTPTPTADAAPPATPAEPAPAPDAPDDTDGAAAPQPATTVPVPAPAPAATAPQSIDAEIVTLGNVARRAAGLPDLATSACAQEQALARASLLVAENRFEHDPLGPILTACGGRTVGENLALGYPTAQATVDAWLASPGHRANLLSPDFTSIGVACVDGPRGALCAQVFLG
ncbi:CAP domain-containing protein [Cellulomonas fimi]|uniref:SCP-like extracellular n=1 Tax=Cellulomonas fimi (strain ATCC 484 / DSM 20113 / JCM 1341 / CCUG 24087 / LMG 16345 / NBRC 15513 / NCIMB 8980 / NCTC 7547 / NRS-133) TaxID=590998 RepID=F4H024_CELFA|nr:CAP domain-containing protein [Cellulomonas fimi]AEE44946.1 SCP-like extracellular [Cellulomonas fimi ATCC 484]NNH07231.1 CAP domain-containing protein [Cellulomonas fimi]VEH27761.1 uncharacterized protein, YkwD family [Cellulomonas fimi]